MDLSLKLIEPTLYVVNSFEAHPINEVEASWRPLIMLMLLVRSENQLGDGEYISGSTSANVFCFIAESG